ncbi:hypothetical protein ACQKIY_25685 [Bacillus mycoides]|uniref:hypothetical protein n=1 Tax=Bacillus mycoides TaxID=1405 RepID=UPI003CFC4B1A
MLFGKSKSQKEKEFRAIEDMLFNAKIRYDAYNLDLGNVKNDETKELLSREIIHLRELIDTLKMTYVEYEKNHIKRKGTKRKDS